MFIMGTAEKCLVVGSYFTCHRFLPLRSNGQPMFVCSFEQGLLVLIRDGNEDQLLAWNGGARLCLLRFC